MLPAPRLCRQRRWPCADIGVARRSAVASAGLASHGRRSVPPQPGLSQRDRIAAAGGDASAGLPWAAGCQGRHADPGGSAWAAVHGAVEAPAVAPAASMPVHSGHSGAISAGDRERDQPSGGGAAGGGPPGGGIRGDRSARLAHLGDARCGQHAVGLHPAQLSPGSAAPVALPRSAPLACRSARPAGIASSPSFGASQPPAAAVAFVPRARVPG